MKKLLLLILLIILLGGCGRENNTYDEVGGFKYLIDSPSYTLVRFLDLKAEVVCWDSSNGGLVCLPICETNIPWSNCKEN